MSKSVEYLSVATKTAEKDYTIAAVIQAARKEIKTAFSSQGLLMLEPYHGATVWSSSCPATPIYQKFFNIYHDSFVRLTLGQTTTQRCNCFIRCSQHGQGFNRGNLLNLVTGEMVYDEKPETTYYVGSTMDLTKGLQYMGQDLKFSMFNLINSSNQRNLLHGHFVRVIILDDEYLPICIKNTEKLSQITR